MKSGIEHDKLIRKILNEIIDTSKYKMSKKFIQHGNTSVYMHSVRVAYISCYIAERYNLKFDFEIGEPGTTTLAYGFINNSP